MATTGSANPASAGAPTPDRLPARHALIGRSTPIDRRFDAARSDLTDIRLADRIFAPHYAAPVARTVLGIAALHADADQRGDALSEMLPGEAFDLLEEVDRRGWGIASVDGVVGYADIAKLGDYAPPTHMVVAPAATLHEAPDINAAILGTLPMGSRIAALGERGAHLLTDHGYVAAECVRELVARTPGASAIATAAASISGIAERRGGRSGAGVDADGLVFLAHDVAGLAVPRFRDLQLAALAPCEPSPGAIAFFADSAGILVDSDTVVIADGRVRRASLGSLAGDPRFGAPVAIGRLA
ncbi:SH3 domain-containing protein [Sphingomonas baiyangensis]|uniref:SH3 domain-containing protein n=1 Tax=Sphingomonas baiyangensis TaxID=2572576 RepID=A0A4U1L270_9SPHN|nr:SH3 domain-containing protein [Sphingomonas baiyangensis]TKD50263.1 SH3 domain-containing protein [Sphingomonas baiyangensis]